MDGFVNFLLTQALDELMLFLLLWVPLLVLASVFLLTLDKLEPRRRRGLFPLFAAMLVLAAALFGGAWLLGRYGLAWRTWFQWGLSGLLWLAGLAAGAATVGYAGRWLEEKGRAVKTTVTGLSALCLASAMLVGTVLGGLWCLGPMEQVVTYGGQRVILGRWVSSCELYEYHGPLVRGAGPMLADWDESLIEGAMNWQALLFPRGGGIMEPNQGKEVWP